MVTQVACGETFSLFLTNRNRLIVTGMLECMEDAYDQLKDKLAVPHEVPFGETVLSIAAGSRTVLILAPSQRDVSNVYLWKAYPNTTALAVRIASVAYV